MDLIGSLILFVVFVAVYSIIIETFTVLFRLTGLTPEKAKTQVISMLTNSGFTTSESEIILHSKKRRKLAQLTMLSGYSFTVIIVSVLVNIFLTLSRTEAKNMIAVVLVLSVVLVLWFLFMRIQIVRTRFDLMIEKIGNRIMFGKNSNIVVLIDSFSERAMAEIYLEFVPRILRDTPLGSSQLKETYNIQILLLKRDGKTVETVNGDTILHSQDILIVFGNYKSIRALFEHPDIENAD